MQLSVVRMDASRREDFFHVHSDANQHGWCRCVAWWVPTWEGWGERSVEENRALRESLFDQGQAGGLVSVRPPQSPGEVGETI